MRLWLFSLLVIAGWPLAAAQSPPKRPIERPSRTAEQILKDEEEARRRAAAEERKRKEAEAKAGEAKVAEAARSKPGVAVFSITGADAWLVASRMGWRFFPRGATGRRDGNGTSAQQHPGLVTSVVQGPRLWQSRTPASWTFVSENVFFLFADDRGRPKELATGWRVRDIDVRGTNWAWVTAPRRGSSTPFCVIQMTGAKGMADSVAEITSLTLEGPTGARDWHAAFASE